MEEEEGEDIGGRRRGGGGGEDQWRRIHGGEREREDEEGCWVFQPAAAFNTFKSMGFFEYLQFNSLPFFDERDPFSPLSASSLYIISPVFIRKLMVSLFMIRTVPSEVRIGKSDLSTPGPQADFPSLLGITGRLTSLTSRAADIHGLQGAAVWLIYAASHAADFSL